MMKQLPIENFEIDKSHWVKVKLGDVVFEPKEAVVDPVAEGIEHVVGLEHIDSDDIHLRRSASIDESKTFTKKFAKGDVLFGRRRAYLRKAAQAEFDGICSGDITVMRSKKGLMPELLPFIVNNDKFFDYAITHSAGGLSPRVKFKDLSNYELSLPVKEKEQLDLWRLLHANSQLVESARNQEKKIKQLFLATIETELEVSDTKRGKDYMAIGELVHLINGKGFKSSEWAEVGVPIIRIQNLNGSESFNYFNGELEEQFRITPGSLLFAWSGNRGTSFGPFWWVNGEGALNQHIFHVKLLTEILPLNLLYYYLLKITKIAEKNAHGGVGLVHITKAGLNQFAIKIPKVSQQIKILNTLTTCEDLIDASKAYFESCKNIQKSIINRIF